MQIFRDLSVMELLELRQDDAVHTPHELARLIPPTSSHGLLNSCQYLVPTRSQDRSCFHATFVACLHCLRVIPLKPPKRDGHFHARNSCVLRST